MPALSDADMIDASLAKVDAANAYICVIGKRYGQVRTCGLRNPDGLSLTELEFERAVSRNLPISVLCMTSDYPVADRDNEFDPASREKLQAFRERVGLPHRATAEFSSWEEFLKVTPKVATELRAALERRLNGASPAAAHATTPVLDVDDVSSPLPPAFHVAKPFAQGHNFVGRAHELEIMSKWALTPSPILLFEAIGGMGKSMVTYHWLDHVSTTARHDWAGRFWYSFYEEGASMNDFCVRAIAYFEGKSPRVFRGRPTGDLETLLLKNLNEKPWLVVMDGLERVLVAYNRYDKAQLNDDEATVDPTNSRQDPFCCVQPADDHLLKSLSTVRQSKLIASTRNTPTALLNASGRPISGIDHVQLTGLRSTDAERMLQEAGITADPTRVRHYLETHFDCHPLMVGVVAGLINTYLPAPGSFDRWIDDPQGAGAVNISTLPGLAAKRTHVLKAAYEELDDDCRKLLGTLAFFSQSVAGEVLVALNPKRTREPSRSLKPQPPDETTDASIRNLSDALEVCEARDAAEEIQRRISRRRAELNEDFQRRMARHLDYEREAAEWKSSSRKADAWLGKAVVELQKRGLVISDRATARYDLHPMVRGFVRHALQSDDAATTGRRVADYAQSRLEGKFESAVSLEDLARGFDIVIALTLGGHLADAANNLTGDLFQAMNRLELYSFSLSLLLPFFPEGWDAGPKGVLGKQAQKNLMESAVAALSGLSDFSTAERICEIILLNTINTNRKSVPYNIGRLAYLYEQTGSPYKRFILLKYHLDISQQLEDFYQIFESKIRHGWASSIRGNLEEGAAFAEQAEQDMLKHTITDNGLILELHALKLTILAELNEVAKENIEDVIILARKYRDRMRERKSFYELGSFFQKQHRHPEAIEAFENSITMCRATNVPDHELMADYAFSLCAVGRKGEAAEIAKRLAITKTPPLAEMARLHLALGEASTAQRLALQGYKAAWADGPPFAFHWKLKKCLEILKSLGIPEPSMPAFDASKISPMPFEAELDKLIEEIQAERRLDEA